MSENMNSANSHYRDDIVKVCVQFSVAWAVVAMGVGVLLAAQLVWPQLNFDTAWSSFGRLRPVHTNGVVFGFGVTALMATAFYTVQRTSMVSLFAPRMAWFVVWGWQLVL